VRGVADEGVRRSSRASRRQVRLRLRCGALKERRASPPLASTGPDARLTFGVAGPLLDSRPCATVGGASRVYVSKGPEDAVRRARAGALSGPVGGLLLLRSCYVGEATTLIVALLQEAGASLLVLQQSAERRVFADGVRAGSGLRFRCADFPAQGFFLLLRPRVMRPLEPLEKTRFALVPAARYLVRHTDRRQWHVAIRKVRNEREAWPIDRHNGVSRARHYVRLA
jgi:hypothetical protein